MSSLSSALEKLPQATKEHLLLVTLTVVVLIAVRNKFQSGLTSIPGPPVAAHTKLWRLYNVWKGSAHLEAIKLHKKYGNLVRIAPNVVSVADPKWISVFYGAKEDYIKVRAHFYPEKGFAGGPRS